MSFKNLDKEKIDTLLAHMSSTFDGGGYRDYMFEERYDGSRDQIVMEYFNGGYDSPPEWETREFSSRSKLGKFVIRIVSEWMDKERTEASGTFFRDNLH